MWKKVKLLNVFYAICILKPFNSHISVVVCSFFEFGTVSKWCMMEGIKTAFIVIYKTGSLSILRSRKLPIPRGLVLPYRCAPNVTESLGWTLITLRLVDGILG